MTFIRVGRDAEMFNRLNWAIRLCDILGGGMALWCDVRFVLFGNFGVEVLMPRSDLAHAGVAPA
jgi:hypothetical protein